MTIPVTAENEMAWAALCAALWPCQTAEEFLTERAGGGYGNEFIYLADGEPAAFMSLSLRHDYVEGTGTSPVGYLEGIYVKPEYRRKGIARALLAYARQWAAERGCREFASDCLLENEDSRAFHNRIGFTEANTIVCFTMKI